MLAGGRTLGRGAHPDALQQALRAAGHQVEEHHDDALTVDATPEQVGRIAAGAGQVLIELPAGGTGGLEDLFFTLTAPGPDQQEPAA